MSWVTTICPAAEITGSGTAEWTTSFGCRLLRISILGSRDARGSRRPDLSELQVTLAVDDQHVLTTVATEVGSLLDRHSLGLSPGARLSVDLRAPDSARHRTLVLLPFVEIIRPAAGLDSSTPPAGKLAGESALAQDEAPHTPVAEVTGSGTAAWSSKLSGVLQRVLLLEKTGPESWGRPDLSETSVVLRIGDRLAASSSAKELGLQVARWGVQVCPGDRLTLEITAPPRADARTLAVVPVVHRAGLPASSRSLASSPPEAASVSWRGLRVLLDELAEAHVDDDALDREVVLRLGVEGRAYVGGLRAASLGDDEDEDSALVLDGTGVSLGVGPGSEGPVASLAEAPSSAWLVVVQDKDLAGEPDVGLGVELGPEAAARLGARLVDELAEAGRARCAYRTREIPLGAGVRLGTLLRLVSPRLPAADDPPWSPSPHPLAARLSLVDLLGGTEVARGLERALGAALGWRERDWTAEALLERVRDLVAYEASKEGEVPASTSSPAVKAEKQSAEEQTYAEELRVTAASQGRLALLERLLDSSRGDSPPALPAPARVEPRDERQVTVVAWARAAFGDEEVRSLPQRGICLLEEALELLQAAGGDRATAHQVVDHVFDLPAGELRQELGGVGVCVLLLAAAAGASADEAERAEIQRVLGKPLDHFRRRNAGKPGRLARPARVPDAWTRLSCEARTSKTLLDLRRPGDGLRAEVRLWWDGGVPAVAIEVSAADADLAGAACLRLTAEVLELVARRRAAGQDPLEVEEPRARVGSAGLELRGPDAWLVPPAIFGVACQDVPVPEDVPDAWGPRS